MAQLERSECVPTRLISMPNFSGPRCFTWETMCALICFAVIRVSLFVSGLKNVLTGDDGVVPAYSSTRLIVDAKALTGQRTPLVTLCWVIVSIFSPFF